jgi:hypothetical protein
MAQLILLLALSYPFFWFHAFDPTLRVRVFEEFNPHAEPTMTYGPIPSPLSWAGFGALFWTSVLGGVVYFTKGRCSLNPTDLLSVDCALGIATVVVTTKIIFGPSYSTFVSLKFTTDGKIKKPLSYVLFDLATVYPVNVSAAVLKKTFVFFLCWCLVLLRHKFLRCDRAGIAL